MKILPTRFRSLIKVEWNSAMKRYSAWNIISIDSGYTCRHAEHSPYCLRVAKDGNHCAPKGQQYRRFNHTLHVEPNPNNFAHLRARVHDMNDCVVVDMYHSYPNDPCMNVCIPAVAVYNGSNTDAKAVVDMTQLAQYAAKASACCLYATNPSNPQTPCPLFEHLRIF